MQTNINRAHQINEWVRLLYFGRGKIEINSMLVNCCLIDRFSGGETRQRKLKTNEASGKLTNPLRIHCDAVDAVMFQLFCPID